MYVGNEAVSKLYYLSLGFILENEKVIIACLISQCIVIDYCIIKDLFDNVSLI